jgi:hypothetical protein
VDQIQFFLPDSLFFDLQLLLQSRQFPVLQLGSSLQIVFSLGLFYLFVDILDLLTETGKIIYAFLFVLPLGGTSVQLILQLSQLLLDRMVYLSLSLM